MNKEDYNKILNATYGLMEKYGCDGSHRFVRLGLHYLNYSETDVIEFIRVAEENGGYCDCEVLMNAEEGLQEYYDLGR